MLNSGALNIGSIVLVLCSVDKSYQTNPSSVFRILSHLKETGSTLNLVLFFLLIIIAINVPWKFPIHRWKRVSVGYNVGKTVELLLNRQWVDPVIAKDKISSPC